MTNSMRTRLAALLLIWAVLMMLAMAPHAEGLITAPDSASACALMEAGSGRILLECNADARLPMASTTKIMTALVVIENADLDEVIEIPDEAVGVEGSSVYLVSGERISVRDLLYGLMLASGNDAAVALALHTAGSIEAFAGLMNDKAAKMGLRNTHFVTVNGLHDSEHYTTAKELMLIAREAVKNSEFKRIVTTKYHRTDSGDRVHTFKNKNSLLWSYEGAFGIKTGYTSAAGRCLVFGAERNGMTLIGVLLNCRPMFEEATRLMDEAFVKYTAEHLVVPERDVFHAVVENSLERDLKVSPKDSIIALIPRGAETSFKLRIRIDEPVCLPINELDAVGWADAFDGDTYLGSTELIAQNSVHERGLIFWFRRVAGLLAGKLTIGETN